MGVNKLSNINVIRVVVHVPIPMVCMSCIRVLRCVGMYRITVAHIRVRVHMCHILVHRITVRNVNKLTNIGMVYMIVYVPIPVVRVAGVRVLGCILVGRVTMGHIRMRINVCYVLVCGIIVRQIIKVPNVVVIRVVVYVPVTVVRVPTI